MESLSQLWSYNITLKERQGQKETVKGVWQRAREGTQKLFEGQLARKCAKDGVLCAGLDYGPRNYPRGPQSGPAL